MEDDPLKRRAGKVGKGLGIGASQTESLATKGQIRETDVAYGDVLIFSLTHPFQVVIT